MSDILPTRQLGQGGPQVTSIGIGLMGLSFGYGKPKSDEERFALLDNAYKLGERHWDSADIYGDNEDLLGKWFAENPDKRKHIFLATKFANKMVNGEMTVDSSPQYVKEACNKSLKRLGLPNVDLYYCHRMDGKTPIEKTVEAMVELKSEGKIKYLGLSECSSATLRRAHKVHPIHAVEIEYSPFALDIENPHIDLLKTCRELGVAVVAYSPLGRGLLGGKIQSRDDFEEGDWRLGAPRFSEENFPKNIKLAEVIAEIAKKKGVTPSQLTLAWLLAQGDDIIPIPGTTNVTRLKENLDSVNVQLSKEEEAEIRKACENAEVHGERYPAAMVSALFADTPEL